MIEHGIDHAQTPLPGVYDVQDSVSLGSNKNLGAQVRDKNSNVRARDDTSVSANNKFWVVFRVRI